MLTTDKTITSAAYWNKIYSGNNNDAKVDASNTKRVSTFDRFDIVVKHVTEDERFIIDIGSGHAHVCKRIRAKFPASAVFALDQSEEAKKISNYKPYIIGSAYNIPVKSSEENKAYDLVICTQALEYMEFPDKFLTEAKRVGKKFLCTVPRGEMKSWSQLYVFDEKRLIDLLLPYGVIEVFETYENLFLTKLKFS